MKIKITKNIIFEQKEEELGDSGLKRGHYNFSMPEPEVKNFFESLESSDVRDALKYFNRKVPRDQRHTFIEILEGNGDKILFRELFLFAKYMEFKKIKVPNFDQIAKNSADYKEEIRSNQIGGPGATMLLDGILTALGIAKD